METDHLPLCSRCGVRRALHRCLQPPTVMLLCCRCYIDDGNPPADWHPECVAAFEARK
jgi:hypothetical protein